ncbi:MAG: ABC transporter permease [Acidimicrobiia bacterium]|nr:ABC transporter permease [Acidimicrobiia bacterium]MDH5615246.1 ABC transporter permease [Acidimicrobiia bacterium]
MRSLELATRNFKEVWRDPLSLGITIGLPVLLLLVLQAFGEFEEVFTPTSLTPGIVLFGFVMLMFSAAMTLSRDRESALFARLLTAPVRASDFVAAYSLPYLSVAIIQGIVLFAIGAFLGLEVDGSVGLVFLVIFVTAVFYIGLGMILGSLLPLAPLSGAYAVVLLLTIFGGAWMDLEAIGGVFQSIGNALPFAHALDATRAVMIDGVGFPAVATDFYWVVGYTLVIVALALILFKRKMLE